MVGVPRFELGASSTRTTRATGLRYTPLYRHLPNFTYHTVNVGDPNDARYRAALHPEEENDPVPGVAPPHWALTDSSRWHSAAPRRGRVRKAARWLHGGL
jgi:hypothetical protein